MEDDNFEKPDPVEEQEESQEKPNVNSTAQVENILDNIDKMNTPQSALRNIVLHSFMYRFPIVAAFNLTESKRGWYSKYGSNFARKTIGIIEKYENEPFIPDEEDQRIHTMNMICRQFEKKCKENNAAYFYVITAGDRVIYDVSYAKEMLEKKETTEYWNTVQISSGVCGLKDLKYNPVKEIIMTQAGLRYPITKQVEDDDASDLVEMMLDDETKHGTN